VSPHAHQFLSSADAHADRRAIEARVQATREQATREISDQVTRDIASVFRAQEAHEAHLADLAQLHALVLEHPAGHPLAGVSPRTQAAFERAREQGNFSALEGLQRELDRDREDEEHALMLLLLH
jgi:hypothetical protein